MKVEALIINPDNPRKITDAKLAQLKKSMLELGDISGVVFNVNTGNVVGGAQRSKNFDQTSKVIVTKKYAKPTRTGTIGEGYILHEGERFNYREVKWDENKELAANIAANKGAGEWDMPKLKGWIKKLSSFDVDFDLTLTMFDADELKKKFGTHFVSEHERSNGGDGVDDTPGPLPLRTRAGQTWQLGPHRLLCGEADLPACDAVLKAWERHSGDEAELVHTVKVKRLPVKQGRITADA